jgi:aryl-alcohol dehydrogenase-like predicted oxidoreductase
MLPTVELGKTGLNVTRLGYGALELRDLEANGGRLPSEAHAGVMLSAVLDAGINFIDTAPAYGRSEEFIGRFIADRRDEYTLASKCGRAWTGAPPSDTGVSEWSHDVIVASVDASLARLGTDYLDLLQLHGPSVEAVEQHDCVHTLEELRASGKTRFIGVSAVNPHLDTFISWGVFDTFQIVYSALEPEHEAAIVAASDAGAGTIVRGGSVKGVPHREQGRGGEFPIVRDRWVRSSLAELIGDRDPVETMFRYALARPHAHTFINGTQNLDHLHANIRAAELGPLDASLQTAIRASVMAVV